MKFEELKELVEKHHLSSYGDIQAEVILYGGTIEDAENIYEEKIRNTR